MTTKITSDNVQPGSITSASLAPGIGGGSSYANTEYVANFSTSSGNLQTPGNSSDAIRGNSGNGGNAQANGQDGKVHIF